MNPTRFYGIYRKGKKLYTQNLQPGKSAYGEALLRQGGQEFREWDPRRSKIAAAIMRGLNQLGVAPGHKALYLGASTGTTVSHISDIVGNDGMVFALDFAPRTMRDLVFLAQERKNIAPVMSDANQPDTYKDRVPQVDWVFQDIAQRNQAEIFLKNVNRFLKRGQLCAIAVKARSIDVAKKPQDVFKQFRKELEEELTVTDYRTLEPFEKDHAFFVCKRA